MLQIQTKLVHDKHVSEKTAKCLIIHFDLLSITAPRAYAQAFVQNNEMIILKVLKDL